MDQRQIDEELDQPGARELLQRQTLLRLAFDGADGFPRVIPIGFLWTRRRIIVCTATTSPKVAALAARPNVAATLDAGDTPASAKALLVRGIAALETVDGVPEEFIAASTKANALTPQ